MVEGGDTPGWENRGGGAGGYSTRPYHRGRGYHHHDEGYKEGSEDRGRGRGYYRGQGRGSYDGSSQEYGNYNAICLS